jgi:predicted membrane protein
MIQRIQSLFLLLVFLISCLMFFVNPSFAIIKDERADKKIKLGYVSTQTYTLSRPADAGISISKPLNLILILSMGLGSVVAIFLFKNKKLQKQLSIYITLIALVILVMVFIDFGDISKQLPGGNSYPGLHTIWPIACSIFGLLSWRGIRADEKLLANMDRIR